MKRLNDANERYKDEWRHRDTLRELEDELLDVINYAALTVVKLRALR